MTREEALDRLKNIFLRAVEYNNKGYSVKIKEPFWDSQKAKIVSPKINLGTQILIIERDCIQEIKDLIEEIYDGRS